MDDKKQRIDALTEELSRHIYRYYTLDNPVISDSDYDAMYDELVRLERETGYVRADSPSLRVGGDVLDKFEKQRHLSPLYSLDKVRSKEELNAWKCVRKS